MGVLDDFDFTRWDAPGPNPDMRGLLIEWLDYQRHEFQRKFRDLSHEQLAEWSVPPVELSVLGLIRHMQAEEHAFLTWGLGGGERVDTYGDDDFAGGSAETVEDDLRLYFEEVEKANRAIAALNDLESPGLGHGRPLGWTLIKMIHEYTLHSGQAHMIRFAALGEIIR